MITLVRKIPDQLEHGWKVAAEVMDRMSPDLPSSLVICGMGGSGISGDLLRGLLLHTSPVPIEVIKDYALPGWIDDRTFAVVISYSGNTEETLSLWNELEDRGVPKFVVTSGGKLAEKAESAGVPVVSVPSGNPPRASVGYLFVSLLRLAYHWKLYPNVEQELAATASLIRSRFSGWEEEARSQAESLKDRFPVIHSLDVRFAPLGYRLVCQLNENAKTLAHTHVYSEMNHNEIMGFEGGSAENPALVILDPGEGFTHPRNRKRAEIVDRILPTSVPRFTIKAEGDSLLERFFSLLLKGDLLSVLLAELRGVDPIPVNSIERLKKELA